MTESMKTIYVQIASYRDRELPSTLQSCLENASHPHRLRFGICWQYDDETRDDLRAYSKDSRFKIDEVHHVQSKGCCWARHRTNQLYDNEDYTLQIDAHMRFAQDWDEKIIELLESIDYDKPLLTTYPPPYKLDNGKTVLKTNHGIQRLKLKKLNLDLSTVQSGEPVGQPCKPGKNRFLAAGYLFTLGKFCREVEYDPSIYFEGEEISLAARAYTHGYNLYYPNVDLLWHLYDHDSPLHWSDMNSVSQEMKKKARDRLETLFLGDAESLGKYGFGTSRTLEQFEHYAGIRFRDVIDRRKLGLPYFFDYEINLNLNDIETGENCELLVFSLLDEEDRVIYRHDITEPDVLANGTLRIAVNATLKGRPVHYTIWPKSQGKWKRKHKFALINESTDENNMEKIFIALAAYREPELRKTIESCIDRAVNPERLRFGICLQYDSKGDVGTREDCIDDLLTDNRFRIVKYPYTSSKGGCWARNIVQSLYRGEAYTLQIDAHSRMVDGWDDVLIDMMRTLPSDKPLITGFPPLYFINDGKEIFTSDDDLTRVPTVKVTSWSKAGWIDHPTELIEHNIDIPRRTRVISGAFVFTLGKWNTEVNQDPDFIYTGEEFALTLRSFTSGYDLFNPTQIVVWHRNHPEPNPKYITDFERAEVSQRQQNAYHRLKILLQGDPNQKLEPFSLGRERSLSDYRIFSGLDCEQLTIHPDARNGVPPAPVTIKNELSNNQQPTNLLNENLIDLTLQLDGMDDLELRCEAGNPVVEALISALEANVHRKPGDENPLMYLQIGDTEDHDIYFPQSSLLSLHVSGAHNTLDN